MIQLWFDRCFPTYTRLATITAPKGVSCNWQSGKITVLRRGRNWPSSNFKLWLLLKICFNLWSGKWLVHTSTVETDSVFVIASSISVQVTLNSWPLRPLCCIGNQIQDIYFRMKERIRARHTLHVNNRFACQLVCPAFPHLYLHTSFAKRAKAPIREWYTHLSEPFFSSLDITVKNVVASRYRLVRPKVQPDSVQLSIPRGTGDLDLAG